MVAIAIGKVHRLHHPVQAGGAVETQLSQGHGLEHLEQLQQSDATTTGGGMVSTGWLRNLTCRGRTS